MPEVPPLGLRGVSEVSANAIPKTRKEPSQIANLGTDVCGGRLQGSQSVGALATNHVARPTVNSRRLCRGNRNIPRDYTASAINGLCQKSWIKAITSGTFGHLLFPVACKDSLKVARASGA